MWFLKRLWHFNFRGVERLVKGGERIYLDRFWNELSAIWGPTGILPLAGVC